MIWSSVMADRSTQLVHLRVNSIQSLHTLHLFDHRAIALVVALYLSSVTRIELRRLSASPVSGHRAADETAKCPESLRPISVLPSSGSRISSPRRALPLRHRYYGLMRQSPWFSSPSALASFEESLPVATSPGYPRDLPDAISANLSSDVWSHATAVPPGALACFFPDVIGLPQQRCGSASRFTREHDFPRSVFRRCRHFLMFRPPSLLVSQIAPTAAHTTSGQLRVLRPGIARFVASARTGYANRPNTGN